MKEVPDGTPPPEVPITVEKRDSEWTGRIASGCVTPAGAVGRNQLHGNRPGIYVQSNLWTVGGTTGWHSHPGHSLITVTAGAVTVYDGDDPACTPHVYTVGMGFVDEGGDHIHVIRNEGVVDERACPRASPSAAPVVTSRLRYPAISFQESSRSSAAIAGLNWTRGAAHDTSGLAPNRGSASRHLARPSRRDQLGTALDGHWSRPCLRPRCRQLNRDVGGRSCGALLARDLRGHTNSSPKHGLSSINAPRTTRCLCHELLRRDRDDHLAEGPVLFHVRVRLADLLECIGSDGTKADVADRESIEIALQYRCGEVTAATAVGRQPYTPRQVGDRIEVRHDSLIREHAGEADGAVDARGGERIGQRRRAHQFQRGVHALRKEVAHRRRDLTRVDKGMVDAMCLQGVSTLRLARGGQHRRPEVLGDRGRREAD